MVIASEATFQVAALLPAVISPSCKTNWILRDFLLSAIHWVMVSKVCNVGSLSEKLTGHSVRPNNGIPGILSLTRNDVGFVEWFSEQIH